MSHASKIRATALREPARVDARDPSRGEILVDVRAPAEFDAVHIPGAHNLPLDRVSEHAAEIARRACRPVLLVCRSGNRARQAAEVLREAGLRDVDVLEGGVAEWVSGGGPVVRGRPRWALDRQVRLVAGSLVAAGAAGSLLLSPAWASLSLAVGAGLVISAVTDTCAMGSLLARLPWNRAGSCDPRAVLDRLATPPVEASGSIHHPIGATAGAEDRKAAGSQVPVPKTFTGCCG